MEDYTSVTLIKITKARTVRIDEEDFLMVDTDIFNGLRSRYTPRPYTHTEKMKEAVLEILTKRPGIGSGIIRQLLVQEYDMEPTPEVMRGCLQRMRNDEKITVRGVKNQAVWFVKEEDGSVGVDEDAR